jgi:hypothetical protein
MTRLSGFPVGMRGECTKRRPIGNPESRLHLELGETLHVCGVRRFIRERRSFAGAVQSSAAHSVWMSPEDPELIGLCFGRIEPPSDSRSSLFQIAKSLYSGFTASSAGYSIPAATVALVPCSTRMKAPVSRLML